MIQQRRQVHTRQIGARIAEGAQTGVVCVLEGPVSARDQDQIARLLRRGREEPHACVGALQLATLDRQPQREQSHAADDRHRRQQHAERVPRIAERLHPKQSVADERNGEQRHDRQQNRRRFDGGFKRNLFERRGCRRVDGGPQIAEERYEPGEIEHGAEVVSVPRDGHARHEPQEESNPDPERQALVRRRPRRSAAEPQGGRDRGHQQQALHLHEPQQDPLAIPAGGQHDARHEQEVRVDERAEHAVRHELDGSGCCVGLAGPAMRPRQERHERSQPAAQAEHRVPLHPRWPAGPDLAENPADVAENPQRQPDEERIPEEPLHAEPLAGGVGG